MREILFKAKRIDTGEWVEGYYVCNKKHYIGVVKKEHYCIYAIEWNEVYSSTICQYTGLTDKNGNKIWENDIIKYHFGEKYAPIKFGTYQNCFDTKTASHVGFFVDWSDGDYLRKDLEYWVNMIEDKIVGNIFDNLELLSREDEENEPYN